MRQRDAPVASRTPISSSRAPALASMRFARFTHEASRTRPERPNRNHNGVEYSARSDEAPPAQGTASSLKAR